MSETKKLQLKVVRDDDPMSPRECDNLGTMVCFHKKYALGDKDACGLKASDFSGWDDLEKHLYENMDALVVLPLHLYDHSGITMQVGSFGDRWDSGQVGFVFVTREKALQEFSRKKVTAKFKEQIEKHLKSEVETYDQYLRGDIWGYVIEDEKGETLDSCWGFFGEESAREEGERSLKSLQD